MSVRTRGARRDQTPAAHDGGGHGEITPGHGMQRAVGVLVEDAFMAAESGLVGGGKRYQAAIPVQVLGPVLFAADAGRCWPATWRTGRLSAARRRSGREARGPRPGVTIRRARHDGGSRQLVPFPSSNRCTASQQRRPCEIEGCVAVPGEQLLRCGLLHVMCEPAAVDVVGHQGPGWRGLPAAVCRPTATRIRSGGSRDLTTDRIRVAVGRRTAAGRPRHRDLGARLRRQPRART